MLTACHHTETYMSCHGQPKADLFAPTPFSVPRLKLTLQCDNDTESMLANGAENTASQYLLDKKIESGQHDSSDSMAGRKAARKADAC